jgi:polar amino acid transport system substrate-binding protein
MALMKHRPCLLHALAPTGRLRTVINLGNPILARAGVEGADPAGVSVDLARELAQRLGVALELQVVDTAAKAVEAVTLEQADVGFFAIDPVRGVGIAFTAPYLLIEGAYLVRDDSPLRDNGQVDVAGRRVVVGQGSAYDLHLTRALRHAKLVRAASSQAVVDTFLSQDTDVAAGVKQQLQADAQRVGGLRLLPGRFMEIRQAMGCPKARGATAAAGLAGFVEDCLVNGFVAESLRRHQVQGATVAAPAAPATDPRPN